MRAILCATCLWCGLLAPLYSLDQVTEKEKAEFRALEVKLWEAWNKRLNPADARSYYSQKPDNLYFDFTPLKFQGWAEYERTAAQALAGGGYAETKINDDFTVIKQGDLVVVAFTFEVKFSKTKGVPATMIARETDVWTKENGRWVIVHQHMSPPSNMGAPPAK
jgi:ketosteroid isomerase-like protein